MCHKPNNQLTIDEFKLPFGRAIRADNRWVKKAAMIPWDEIEKEYAKLFADNIGSVAKPAHMVLDALIIKEHGDYFDEETVEQVRENPYLQYFIGLKEFTTEAPFDPSLMVHCRKWFSLEVLNTVNEKICPVNEKDKGDGSPSPQSQADKQSSQQKKLKNKGKLIVDATCSPADIRYPTDLSLLNQAREKTEEIIGTFYKPLKGAIQQPRTYRVKAHRQYLSIAKTRRPKRKQIRKAIGQQLRYVRWNLASIRCGRWGIYI